MNLRTLKKLSKRAAPLLPLLGDTRQQFPAERWDNYTGLVIRARKHWDRSPCHPSYEPWSDRSIKVTTRAGQTIAMSPPSHPLKGTVMVGAVTGYYEPEWDEQTAYEALLSIVRVEFTDWIDRDEVPPLTRRLDTPSHVFAAARDLVDQRERTS